LFYGGLWWTVLRGTSARRPALWFGSSLLFRFGIVLAGFYVVVSQHWILLLPCLLGFILGRVLVFVGTAKRKENHAS
jgi:F1F0 ATPase subunit 2